MILSTGTFDPDEPSEGPSGQYLNRKDLRRLLIVFALILLILWPVYGILKKGTEEHLCKNNMRAISQAIGLYTDQWDGRYPPAFFAQDNGSPILNGRGAAVSWVTLVSSGVEGKDKWSCPTAGEDEAARSEGPEGTTILSTYGLYAPYSNASATSVPNPGRTALFAETSNLGSADTYDPLKFFAEDGAAIKEDGFVIGFDDAQMYPTPASKFVTRLAFGGSKGAVFEADGETRHGDGIHVITVEGSLIRLGPKEAAYGGFGSYWTAPPKPRNLRLNGP